MNNTFVVAVVFILVCCDFMALHGFAQDFSNGPANAPEGTRAGQQRSDNRLKLKLIWCPPGTFKMGSPKTERGHLKNEEQVEVTFSKGFWLGKYEVTRSQWHSLMDEPGEHSDKAPTDKNDKPINRVTWDEAKDFCEKLTEQERSAGRLNMDWEYALPKEAHWEYACRAGTTTAYCFGDDDSDLVDYAWFGENTQKDDPPGPHPVGKKKANAWGFHDMYGNVREWCREKQRFGPGTTFVRRICRGGGFDSSSTFCRTAHHYSEFRDRRERAVGFRLALLPTHD